MMYMPPEAFRGATPDRRVDIYGAAVVLWETLVGRRLFAGETDADTVGKILAGSVQRPGVLRKEIPDALDALVARGLSSDPDARYPTAHEMATALESACPVAAPAAVGAWVDAAVADVLAERATLIAAMERDLEVSRVRASSGAALDPPLVAEAVADPQTVTSVSVTREPDARALWRWTRVAAIGAVAGIVAASVVLGIGSVRRRPGDAPATPSPLATAPALAPPPSAPVPNVTSESPAAEPLSSAPEPQGTSPAIVAPRSDRPAPTGGARPSRKQPVRFEHPD